MYVMKIIGTNVVIVSNDLIDVYSAIKSYIRETNMVGAKISCQIIG